MLFPFTTDRPLRRPTVVTYILLAANIVLFAVVMAMNSGQPGPTGFPLWWQQLWGGQSVSTGAEPLYRWSWLVAGEVGDRPWSLLTYAFLHADGMHLLGNMACLWVFGPNVEDRFGRVGFASFYLASAVAAGGAHIVTSPVPVIGASGAIAAVTGAYLVLFPRTHIKCLVFFFFIGIYWIPAAWFILFAVSRDIYAILKSSTFLLGGTPFSDSVAHTAHVAGYALGFALSIVLLATRRLDRETYDLFTIGRQAYRRRQLREAAVLHDEQAQPRVQSRRKQPESGGGAADLALAEARAAVSGAISSEDFLKARELYRGLADRFGHVPGACVLSRNNLYLLANKFFQGGDMTGASFAYEQFLNGYRADSEAPSIRLLLGRINARYLNDPVRARQLLVEAIEGLHDADQKAMARSELDSLA